MNSKGANSKLVSYVDTKGKEKILDIEVITSDNDSAYNIEV